MNVSMVIPRYPNLNGQPSIETSCTSVIGPHQRLDHPSISTKELSSLPATRSRTRPWHTPHFRKICATQLRHEKTGEGHRKLTTLGIDGKIGVICHSGFSITGAKPGFQVLPISLVTCFRSSITRLDKTQKPWPLHDMCATL